MVDQKDNANGVHEDIRDRHLLPDEPKVRKSLKYGAAGLLGLGVVGMWSNNLERSGQINNLEKERTVLDSRVLELEGNLGENSSRIEQYESEIASLKTSVDSASKACLLYTSPSPRDKRQSRMPSSA